MAGSVTTSGLPAVRLDVHQGGRSVPYFFDQVDFSQCLDVHPGYVGTGVVRSECNLKRTLPETADVEYIAGFVDGWLAADGDAAKAGGSWRLRSTDHEALAWVEAVAPYAGFVTVGAGEESSRETNFGVRSRPIRWLCLATRDVSSSSSSSRTS